MAMTRASYGELLRPGLRKVIYMAYKNQPSRYSDFLNVLSSKKAYEEWTAWAGVGPAVEKLEGKAITYKDPTGLPVKRITHVTYGLGMRQTMEAKSDEQYGIAAKIAQSIGKAHKVRREIEAANMFNGAFGTWNNTGFDGKALCATDHPLYQGQSYSAATTDITSEPQRSGSTCSNKLATASDLDYTSLQDMITLARRTVDEDGDFLTIEPRKLLIPPELDWVAREITRSPDRPDTANRAKNVLPSIQVDTWHFLLDTDAWFLLGDQHDLNFFNRMDLQTDMEDDFDTGDTLYRGIQRFSTGFGDWRGIYGTPGA